MDTDPKERGTLIKTISHDEIKEFVLEAIQERRPLFKMYYRFFTGLGLVFLASLSFAIFAKIKFGHETFLSQIGWASIFSFTLLIPVHELIHAAAYKLAGAKNVYFGANLRKFMFYAASDMEVFNGRQFRMIALAPFITINVLGLLSAILFPDGLLFILTTLFLHSFFCTGDMAFVNYISGFDLDRIHTYDSREKKESYFYLLPEE